jgi:hypothetical protein
MPPYLLTTWNPALLENFEFPQLEKDFSAFYRNPSFISMFIITHHFSLSSSRLIQLATTEFFL